MTSFTDLTLADNPDPRAACSLVLDCSDSMTEVREGETRTPLEALNGGLDRLVTELHKDPLARRRVEVSFVPYGTEAADPTPFTTVDELILPTLTPMGVTSTGAALVRALDSIEERKAMYKANGVDYYRPTVLLISDGLWTDDVSGAIEKLQQMEARNGVTFFAVGVEGADLEGLSKLSSKRGALALQGMKFDELFQWLSASQSAVSASQPGDAGVSIPSPAGWATLDV